MSAGVLEGSVRHLGHVLHVLYHRLCSHCSRHPCHAGHSSHVSRDHHLLTCSIDSNDVRLRLSLSLRLCLCLCLRLRLHYHRRVNTVLCGRWMIHCDLKARVVWMGHKGHGPARHASQLCSLQVGVGGSDRCGDGHHVSACLYRHRVGLGNRHAHLHAMMCRDQHSLSRLGVNQMWHSPY